MRLATSVLRRDLHLRELRVPRRIGSGRRVEVPAGKLRRKVRLGALDAYGREGDLQHQLLALRRSEVHAGVVPPCSNEVKGRENSATNHTRWSLAQPVE